jgi:hypothetical protein
MGLAQGSTPPPNTDPKTSKDGQEVPENPLKSANSRLKTSDGDLLHPRVYVTPNVTSGLM